MLQSDRVIMLKKRHDFEAIKEATKAMSDKEKWQYVRMLDSPYHTELMLNILTKM